MSEAWGYRKLLNWPIFWLKADQKSQREVMAWMKVFFIKYNFYNVKNKVEIVFKLLKTDEKWKFGIIFSKKFNIYNNSLKYTTPLHSIPSRMSFWHQKFLKTWENWIDFQKNNMRIRILNFDFFDRPVLPLKKNR